MQKKEWVGFEVVWLPFVLFSSLVCLFVFQLAELSVDFVGTLVPYMTSLTFSCTISDHLREPCGLPFPSWLSSTYNAFVSLEHWWLGESNTSCCTVMYYKYNLWVLPPPGGLVHAAPFPEMMYPLHVPLGVFCCGVTFPRRSEKSNPTKLKTSGMKVIFSISWITGCASYLACLNQKNIWLHFQWKRLLNTEYLEASDWLCDVAF